MIVPTEKSRLVTATLVLSSLFLVNVENFSIVSCTAAAFCTNHRSGKYEITPKMNRRSSERKRFPSNDKNTALASVVCLLRIDDAFCVLSHSLQEHVGVVFSARQSCRVAALHVSYFFFVNAKFFLFFFLFELFVIINWLLKKFASARKNEFLIAWVSPFSTFEACVRACTAAIAHSETWIKSAIFRKAFAFVLSHRADRMCETSGTACLRAYNLHSTFSICQSECWTVLHALSKQKCHQKYNTHSSA